MKIRNILEKIKNFEVYDFFIVLCGVAAIIIGCLDFFGFMHLDIESLLQVIISASGVLLLSQLAINKRIILSNNMLLSNKINNDYVTDFPENIIGYIKDATAINIYGIELYRDIDRYYTLFASISEKGIPIKVLLADSDGYVINMVKLRYPNNDSSATENIKRTIGLLRELNKIKKSKIEIKQIDYLFPRKTYFIELEDDGVLFISNYTFRLANDKAKYIFHKGKDNNYTFYEKEFKLMWEVSKIVF
jgi:hypothetical protein